MDQDPLADEISALAVDGAYYRLDSLKKAKTKEIEMNVPKMTDRKPSKDKLPVNQFLIDKNNRITKCPNGHKPEHSKYDSEKKVNTAKFLNDDCAFCPLLNQCLIQQQKKTAGFVENKLQTDIVRSEMNSK